MKKSSQINDVEKLPNIDTSRLYRMPWTMADNSSTWLEITRDCDISCEYCPQEHEGTTHKKLSTVKHEVDELMKLRKADSIVIAGGEPLIHPDLIDIVRYVKSKRVKPVIITNAVSLDKALLKKLKRAGLFGFIFHVDSGQHRPGWEGKTEAELNEFRQKLVDMLAKEKGVVTSFITTILPEALDGVADIVAWMSKNSKYVAQNILIPVRGLYKGDPWGYYVDGESIDIETTAYLQERTYQNMTALDIAKKVKESLPDFSFCSFLGGTKLSNAPKWVFDIHLTAGDDFLGSVGPRAMEILQNGHHLLKGTFVSFLAPWVYRSGRLMWGLALFDVNIRKILMKRIKAIFNNFSKLFQPIHIQSLIVMQPFDILANGESDLCDGCPNKTYWNGRLVSECRMEEYINFGTLMRFVPEKKRGA